MTVSAPDIANACFMMMSTKCFTFVLMKAHNYITLQAYDGAEVIRFYENFLSLKSQRLTLNEQTVRRLVVNFTNNLHAAFMYESFARTFFVLTIQV